MIEKWQACAGFPDYEVSDTGRVRSYKYGPPRILKQSKDSDGYPQVTLCRDCKKITQKVHRLVLRTFVGEPPNGYVTDHINTIVTDNRLENLRWVSAQQNMNNPITRKHLTEKQQGNKNHMKGRTGFLHHRSKTVMCLENGAVFGSAHEAARKMKIDVMSISNACLGKQQTAAGYHWRYVIIPTNE